MNASRPGRLVRSVYTGVDVIVGALAFGKIGSRSGHEITGVLADAALGGVIGYGRCVNAVGGLLLVAVSSVVLTILLGPGFDDTGGVVGRNLAISWVVILLARAIRAWKTR